jgi:prevent-host-death family protein
MNGKGDRPMKTMGISEFKTHALKILDQVSKNQEIVVVTKRGRPIVRISPCRTTETLPVPGRLSESLVFEKDIVSPLGEDIWDACR